jgi:hypothetical protein
MRMNGNIKKGSMKKTKWFLKICADGRKDDKETEGNKYILKPNSIEKNERSL